MEFFLFSGMLTAAHVSRVPARSGAPQFALWASSDDRYDTLSRVRTPGAPLPVKPLSHKYSTQKIFRIDDGHVGITEVL